MIFFQTNPESKYQKDRKVVSTQPTKKNRSHRQPCQEIQIKDISGKKQSRKEEERIESRGKRVA